MPAIFKCAHCGGIFKFDQTNEEAKKKLHEHFGNVPVEDCAIVCDDCYNEYLAWEAKMIRSPANETR